MRNHIWALLLALACAGCAAQPPAATPAPATPDLSARATSAVAAATAATPPAAGSEVALPNVEGPAAATATAGSEVALPNVEGPAAPPAADATPAAEAAPTSAIALPNVEGPALGADATVVPDATIAATVGGQTLNLQVVASPETRQQGLMFYRELPQDAGMLFVFPTDGELSFWMRNTLIPLSVAFLDADRRILNIADMQPLDDRTFHRSSGPARYALEVNQGWFAARGIEPGAVVEFTLPPDLAVR